MKSTIALLSDNQQIITRVTEFHPAEVLVFKTHEAIKREDFSLLLADYHAIGTADSIQFILSKIRKKIHDKPVILIVAENETEFLQMDWFFDDFIVQPFSRGEITTRIKKTLWKRGLDEDVILIGRLMINLKEYSVYLDNQKLDLTHKEFELLRLLVQNCGEVFTRKDLLSKIWGIEYIGGTRTVDVHVRRLRGKLGNEFNSIIETVRNVGYRCKG